MERATAPKAIATRDESLMKCPFETRFEDDDMDFRVDKDEEQMQEKKEAVAEPLPDFKVAMAPPHKSEIDAAAVALRRRHSSASATLAARASCRTCTRC